MSMVLRRFLAYVTYRNALLWFCGPAAGCPAWASLGDEATYSTAIIVVERGDGRRRDAEGKHLLS
jgi:hypothetical protein